MSGWFTKKVVEPFLSKHRVKDTVFEYPVFDFNGVSMEDAYIPFERDKNIKTMDARYSAALRPIVIEVFLEPRFGVFAPVLSKANAVLLSGGRWVCNDEIHLRTNVSNVNNDISLIRSTLESSAFKNNNGVVVIFMDPTLIGRSLVSTLTNLLLPETYRLIDTIVSRYGLKVVNIAVLNGKVIVKSHYAIPGISMEEVSKQDSQIQNEIRELYHDTKKRK